MRTLRPRVEKLERQQTNARKPVQLHTIEAPDGSDHECIVSRLGVTPAPRDIIVILRRFTGGAPRYLGSQPITRQRRTWGKPWG